MIDETPVYLNAPGSRGYLVRQGDRRYTVGGPVRRNTIDTPYFYRLMALCVALDKFRHAMPFRFTMSLHDTCLEVTLVKHSKFSPGEARVLYELVLLAFCCGINDYPADQKFGSGVTCMIIKNMSSRPAEGFKLEPPSGGSVHPDFGHLLERIPGMNEVSDKDGFTLLDGDDTARAVALMMATAYLAGSRARSVEFLAEVSRR
jgi:hypothetical protein